MCEKMRAMRAERAEAAARDLGVAMRYAGERLDDVAYARAQAEALADADRDERGYLTVPGMRYVASYLATRAAMAVVA